MAMLNPKSIVLPWWENPTRDAIWGSKGFRVWMTSQHLRQRLLARQPFKKKGQTLLHWFGEEGSSIFGAWGYVVDTPLKHVTVCVCWCIGIMHYEHQCLIINDTKGICKVRIRAFMMHANNISKQRELW